MVMRRCNDTIHRADLKAGGFRQILRSWRVVPLGACFVKNPREVLANMAAAIEPDRVDRHARIFRLCSWLAAPPCADLEEFVRAAMASWRA
jgi:hypothetical protein